MFVCNPCSFSCSKKSNYNTHIHTKKHQQQCSKQKDAVATTIKDKKDDFGVNTTTETRQYICESCSNVYKDRSGLWRHVKKCHNNSNNTKTATAKTPTKNAEHKMTVYDSSNAVKRTTASKKTPHSHTINKKMPEESTESIVDGNVNISMLNMIYDLVKQNQEIKEMLLKQHELMMDQTNRPTSIIQQQIIHNHTTNNHAHVNINLFLQEKCKYAMNMNEFVDNLTVEMCDLEMVGRLGFVEGISRIIINRLRSLDIYTRPIHCTDTKRDTIYIRERDEWTRDTDDKEHTKRAIARVADKNLNKIPEWKRLHPETDIFESNAYNMNMQLMIQSLGGIGGTSAEKTARNQEKIWKRIMPEVAVDKKELLALTSGRML